MNDLRAQVAGLEHQVQQLQASPPTAIDEVAHHHRLRGLEELERVRMALEGENRSLRSRLEMVERGPSAPPLLLIMRQVARREVDMMRPLLLQEVTRTAGPQPSRDFTGLGSVCGWSSRRVIENSMFTFAFKKSVRRPPRQLYLAVWRMLMEPAGVRSIFSPRIKMRCQILQSIDADNVLAVIDYYPLDSRPGEATRRCKTLFLIAKFDGQDGGKSIVIRAVDRYRLLLADAVGTADEWADLFAWYVGSLLTWLIAGMLTVLARFHFAPAGDGKSSNVWFGGGIPTVESTCYIWMLEVLFVVLRLETALATFLSQ